MNDISILELTSSQHSQQYEHSRSSAIDQPRISDIDRMTLSVDSNRPSQIDRRPSGFDRRPSEMERRMSELERRISHVSTSQQQQHPSSSDLRKYHLTSPKDDWELDDLLEKHSDADEEEEPEKKSWKKYAKLILPHVGLILLSCVYVVSGALVIYHLEKPNELQTRERNLILIAQQRRQFLDRMWNLSKTMEMEGWRRTAFDDIERMTETLFEAFDTQFINAQHLNDNYTKYDTWTFTNAIFFTSTLLTTIGYGNLVPVTFYGRMFCICYGLLGVPLVLITIADFGKFLSEHIVWLYTRYLDFKKRSRARCYGLMCSSRERRRRQRRAEKAADAAAKMLAQESENRRRKSSGATSGAGEALNELEKLGLEGFVAIPMTLVLLILIGYIALGALLVSMLEHWEFFDAFYFSFITMTTVGFGDLVPENEDYFFLDLLYIVVGLAVTTMCIDLVGIQYIRKIHYFGRAIQDARFALVNVGGKMVQVGDLVKYAAFLHRKYGIQDSKIKIIENPMYENPFPDAFTPREIKYIRYIDFVNGLGDACSLHSYSSRDLGGRRGIADADDSDEIDNLDDDPGDTTFHISTWNNI